MIHNFLEEIDLKSKIIMVFFLEWGWFSDKKLVDFSEFNRIGEARLCDFFLT
jgi:hypothetical protein